MRIIKLTLWTTTINSLVAGILAACYELKVGYFIFITIIMFANIVIPILAGTTFYTLVIKPKMTSYFNMTVMLALSFFIGLVIWAVLDKILYLDQLTIDNVIEDFKLEFLGFTPFVLSTALLLPLIDRKLKNKPEETPMQSEGK